MLIGQVVNGGPKKLAKGAKITKEYLDDLDKYHWFDIRPADEPRHRAGSDQGIDQREASPVRSGLRREAQETDPGR
jgi:hypothetical protein